MNKKKDHEQLLKSVEKQTFIQNLTVLDERKAVEEARRAKAKSSYLGSGIDMLGQVTYKNQIRESETMQTKLQEFNERKQLEQFLKQSEEQEREQKLLKRMKLIQLSEADRKLKHETSQKLKTIEVQREADKNIITKFFNRPTHQAYELRARQDAVLSQIGDKFQNTKALSKS